MIHVATTHSGNSAPTILRVIPSWTVTRHPYRIDMIRTKNIIRSTFLRKAFGGVLWLFLFGLEPHTQAQINPSYISTANGLVSPYVKDVIQDGYGLLWIATANGIQKYDGYKFETFKNAPGKSTTLQSNETWGLEKYVGVSASGLNKIDMATNTVTYFINDINNENSPSSNTITDIYSDSHGMIWLATTAGINKFDPNPKSLNDTRKQRFNCRLFNDLFKCR